MISQLLATIMMALGVASGTKSTSNTFYDAEKPQVKKAVDNDFTITETYNQTPLQTLVIGADVYYKYTINGHNETSTNAYFNITNTTYIRMNYGSSSYGNFIQTILKFENYYNTYTEFELNLEQYIPVGTSYYWGRYYSQPTAVNLDQYYNMTMTNNIGTELYNLDQSAQSVGWAYTETGTQTSGSSTQRLGLTTNRIRLEPNETLQLYFSFYVIDYSKTSGFAVPTNLIIRGTAITPSITQEVVDIPGIMFDVLVMPFSFISTAFDLTIFPGTPYQINFTNLFMVILATFILLWLIKKVFK